jgi:hypothetical protein
VARRPANSDTLQAVHSTSGSSPSTSRAINCLRTFATAKICCPHAFHDSLDMCSWCSATPSSGEPPRHACCGGCWSVRWQSFRAIPSSSPSSWPQKIAPR